MILAPPVPRKVMVSSDELSSFTTNVTIEQSGIFYNQFIRLLLDLTPFVPFSFKGEGNINI